MHLSIGKFSRLSRLSVKALRHYDEIGLLKPAEVDADTGYRYYTVAQASDAERIAMLRAVDMPLPDIAAVLRSGPDIELQLLEKHRARLTQVVASSQQHLQSVERLLARLSGEKAAVALKDAAAWSIISRRASLTPEQVGPFVSTTIISLAQALFGGGGRAGGPPLTLYHESPLEDAIDLEVAITVDDRSPLPAGLSSRALVAERVAFTEHRGAYEDLPHAYRQLVQWVNAQGLSPIGAWREVYLVTPATTQNPEEFITEVQLPVGTAPA